MMIVYNGLIKKFHPNFTMTNLSRFNIGLFTFPVFATVIYICVFYPLHNLVGDGVTALSIFPVALAGWLLGIQWGILWSIIFLFLNIALFLVVGDLPLAKILLSADTARFLSLLCVGIASGWVGNLNKRVKKELVERNQFEDALRKSEQQYRSLFENMEEGIAIDLVIYENGQAIDWIIQDINSAYERILSVKRENVVGQYASRIYGSFEAIASLLQDYDQAIKTRKPFKRQIHSLIGERELVYSVSSLGENRVAVIFTDITGQENALAEEKEQRKLSDAMQVILSALNSTIHLDDVLNIILEHMGQFASYDAADIMLLEEGRLRIVRHRGYFERGLEKFAHDFDVSLEEIISNRWMAENLYPLIISDTSQSDLWQIIPETAWIASYIGIPVIAKGKIIGLLNFSSAKKDFFKNYPIERLKPFTDQVALAIENSRAYEETQKRAYRLSLINRVASQLNLPADLKEIQRLAVDSIAEALNLDQVGLALLNHDKQYLSIVAYHPGPGNRPLVGSTIPLENNPSMDYIIEHKSSFWSDDAQHDPRLTAVKNFMTQQSIFGILIIPLIIRGELIGTMGCDILVPGKKLTEEEINLAETLTNFIAGRIEQSRLLEAEKRRAAELAMLHDTTLEITQSYELPKLLEQIVERATWLLDSSAGLLYLLEPENGILECKVSFKNFYDQVGTTLKLGEGAAGIVAQKAYPLIIPDYAAWNGKAAIYEDVKTPFALLCAPVIWQSQVKGVIQLIRERGKAPFETKDVTLLGLFSSQVAISLENTSLYQEVQQLAVEDSLTGLFNRRGFEEIGSREIERARRFQHPFSVLFLDIDYFKAVNDQYGHAAGDQVLKCVADRCHSALRNIDVIGRYGGEEFVMLLLETDKTLATCIADRLRASIADDLIPTDYGRIHLTVSIGVAQYLASMDGLEDLIHKADQAVYKAKASGRNCVCSD
jgi:diguanylate cyclase (GGDEF)-like protein